MAFFKKKSKLDFIKAYENNSFSLVFLSKKHKKQKKFVKFLKYFAVFLLCLTVVVLFLGLKYLNNFEKIYQYSIEGKSDLESTIKFLSQKNFSLARNYSVSAEDNFAKALAEVNNLRTNYLFSRLSFVESQLNDIDYLLKSGQILSQAGQKGLLIAVQLEEILGGDVGESFSKLDEGQKKEIFRIFYESGPEIYGIKATLDLAYLNLNQIKGNGILLPFKYKIEEIRNKLENGILLVSDLAPISEILLALAGYPAEKNYLIMFQNNDELRPTGGFLGTFGLAKTKNGDLIDFSTHDIYHMDMPSEPSNIEPPAPIKKYMIENWYMRDANWSPDWPESAQNILWFYKKEYEQLPEKDKLNQFGGDFDGVFGITPDFVMDLLEFTGPIKIDETEYNQENFQELLQYQVEIGYKDQGISSWQRKGIIGEIFKEIKIRLLDLSSQKWISLVSVINKNIQKKDILLYFNDYRLEDIAMYFDATGELKKVPSDYLMVVDANLAAFKTDAVVDKRIAYSIDQGTNGIFSNLSLSYSHKGGFDWRTTRYRSYTRVYVPEGSEILFSEGVDIGDIDISNELGKTVFGFFFSLEPGQIKNIIIKYRLPDRINSGLAERSYSLFIQKQPGKRVEELTVDLIFNNKLKSYKPTGFFVEKSNDKQIIWKTNMETDKIFIAEFN